MKLATGVDLIEIERIQEAIARHGERFLRRVYTDRELDLCGQASASLAVRFAAKEAVAKALGTGIGEVRWQDIEILRDDMRAPVLHLHGDAQKLADSLGLQTWSVSLSHTDTHAIAFVVALGVARN
jgi:holo-[acyl-carrier protein] synthase